MHKLLDNGLKINDYVVIRPSKGRKKAIRLDRVSFRVVFDPRFESIEKTANEIHIPTLEAKMNINLSLCPINANTNKSDDLRFRLKSEGEFDMYKLNGSYCEGSFVERKDKMTVEYSQLEFVSSLKEQNVYENKIPLPDTIIKSSLNILIQGATGTGKSTLAKEIHHKSERLGDFVQLNLSAISPNLIESELFGHIKGAFTGAASDKKGALQQANYGTVFLDEVDSIPLDIQTKLLLFFDNKTIRPVGSNIEKKCDVRIILATSKNLSKMVEENKFRLDFYYRVTSGFQLSLPSLNNRPQKIESLIQQFEANNDVCFEQKLLSFYKNQKWKGNIRQLVAHLEKKKVMSKTRKIIYCQEDERLFDDFVLQVDQQSRYPNLNKIKEDYCKKIFYHYEGDIKLTCSTLNVTPVTLKKFVHEKVG